jgi:hypothetical protein
VKRNPCKDKGRAAVEPKKSYERYLEKIAELRLMDDDFFSEALDEKIAPVEYILNTILERDDIRVQRTEAQVEYKSATKRSIKLDIRAVDAEGRVMDIEVQRAEKGAGVRRARFHSSMIDRTLLEKGDDFESLVDTYVIFITEQDRFGAGLPLYHVERKITELNDAMFGDGAHIIYVNGAFRDLEHPVGRLMHDMNCRDAKEMLNPLLAEEVRYLKETNGGRTQMCRAFEEVAKEAAMEAAKEAEEKTKRETARNLIALNQMSVETIAKCVDLPVEEVRALAERKPA